MKGKTFVITSVGGTSTQTPGRQIEYVNGIPYIELYGSVNWEIIGLDSGWFEQAFSSKYRVVRILTNICDSSVVGDDRTNVLGEAKVDAVMAEGQQYYEPTHLRYVPLRERELDVIEITLEYHRNHLRISWTWALVSRPWCSISSDEGI